MQSILEKDNGSILNTALGFFELGTGKSANTDKNKNDYMGGSVSKYVKDLVMTFPTMFDTSLSPSTAGMISKANERNVVTMLELLFGSMQLTAKDGREALQKVHNNLKTPLDIDDIANFLSENGVITKTNSNMVGKVRISDYITEMNSYLKIKQKSYPVNSLNETSLMDYMVYKDYYGNDVVRKTSGKSILKEADNDKFADDREEREKRREKREIEKAQKEELPRLMTDMDYKKANELTPTLIVVTFNRLNTGGTDEKATFIAGVKSRLIPVSPSDVIERLAAKKNTALNFLNFVRATTGEISFCKDFLFAVKQSKILAKNAAKKGPVAKMWNVLDARHVKNNRNALRGSGNDASAITTLVINQETVNMLKKDYNYDIEDPKVARYIMSEYNLLGLIICDESIETAKMLYHGNEGFELNPYSFLNRENNDSKAYKEVINLVNQTRR